MSFSFFYPSGGAENSFIYLLTGILFLFAVISFLKCQFDILHPVVIYNLCLSGCCALAALYTDIWDLPMHFNTAMILIVMSVLFILGGILAEFRCSASVNAGVLETENGYLAGGFSISWPMWLVMLVLLGAALHFQYVAFLEAARQVTNETSWGKMTLAVLNGLRTQDISFDRWYAYRIRFANIVAYVSILAVWLNLPAHRYKDCVKWGALALLYIPFLILTGGRQQFMYVILFALVSFLLVRRKYFGKGVQSLRKELLLIGIAIGFFLLSFLGIGLLNGKVGAAADFFKSIAHYAGTNISAFDVYINEMLMDDSPYIGTRTFCAVYTFLHNHGFDVPEYLMYIYLFTDFNSVTTNVYTAFYRYIHDFGYLGCGLVVFLLGFFYTFLYRQLYLHGLKNWMILLYSSIVFPIFLMGREERFFNEIVNTARVSFLVGLFVLYKIFEILNERRREGK